MKMRNNLNAAADVVVKEICTKVGDRVDEGQSLVVFE